MACANERAPFIHPDSPRMDFGFQTSASPDMNNSPTTHDACEMSPHLQMPRLNGKREFCPGIFFDDNRWGGDLTDAGQIGGKMNRSLGF